MYWGELGVVELKTLLMIHSYAIKNQRKARYAPNGEPCSTSPPHLGFFIENVSDNSCLREPYEVCRTVVGTQFQLIQSTMK